MTSQLTFAPVGLFLRLAGPLYLSAAKELPCLVTTSKSHARNQLRSVRGHKMFSTMDWQQATALVIVAVTAAILLWSRMRRRKFSLQRDTHCGCGGGASDAPKSSIIFRARKGEQPQVVVKMR
jgi:hypothetical protein